MIICSVSLERDCLGSCFGAYGCVLEEKGDNKGCFCAWPQKGVIGQDGLFLLM